MSNNIYSGGIFRISDGTEMTPTLLAEYLKKHDELITSKYKPLKDAYETDYEIFHLKKKEPYKPDNRIAVNFAKYITDTMNGFFLGIPIKVFSDDKAVDDEVNLLDKYNDQDDQNAELSKLCDIYGHAYEMYFNDEAGELGITYLSPVDAFMIYDESIIERPRYFIRTYMDTQNIKHGSISDESTIRWFTMNPSLKWDDGEPRQHGFLGVPAVEYLENAERQGLFEPVMSMINAYNKAISEKANDVDYFSDAYLKILGAKLENEDLQHIRENRIINFDGANDGSLVVDFMQKPSADETQENLINRLERLIFMISMVANISDENFGTSSGIALKYKLQSMSNLAKTKERKFTSGMNQRYKLLFSNPVSGMKQDDWTKVEYTFTRNFPANLLEEAQIASQLSGIVSQETQLKVLSIVDDVQDEIDKLNEQKEENMERFTQYSLNRTEPDQDEGQQDEE